MARWMIFGRDGKLAATVEAAEPCEALDVFARTLGYESHDGACDELGCDPCAWTQDRSLWRGGGLMLVEQERATAAQPSFVRVDGGRAEAGFTGSARDCVARAIAIALERPYAEVYAALNELAERERPRNGRTRSSARTGVWRATYQAYLEQAGWEWVPTMRIGSGAQVHLRADELPSGRIIARLSKHLVAVIDGVVHDSHDPSRGGTRCVYGYFRPASAAAAATVVAR